MLTANAVKPSLTITRRFKAPPAKVFAAWIDPEKVKLWMGPRESEIVVAKIDARQGGRYDWVAQTPSGERHAVGGVYREIIPNQKLVFTWAWASTPERESLVTVTFKSEGDGTLMTLHHAQFHDEGVRDRHNQGWEGALEKFEKLLS